MRSTKRSFAAVIAAALVASVLALVASPAGALASVTATTRLSGADRYATAAKVANPAGTTTNESHFVLVSGQSYADGLSAAALAGALDTDGAAVLLTDPTTLTTSTLTTMAAMSGGVAAGSKYVHIVGGESAVSAGIATQLTASGYNVTRVSGSDRYKTADAVAAAVKTQNGGNIGTMGGYRTAFLVNGNGYADALAVSGYSYDAKLPVFMTDGTTLSAGTSAAIAAAKVQKVIVIGGTAAVSDAVKDAALAVSTVSVVSRVSGADRYATATALADTIAAVDTSRRVKAILVDGNNFPDGLAASQYAASENATILLVNGATLPSSVTTWLTGKQAYLSTIATIGGTAAVPAAAVTAAKTAATKPAITATISKAVDAGTGFTVTFSGRVTEASAETAANYTICSKFGVCRVPTTGGSMTLTYTYTASTGVSKMVLAAQGTAFAPGDTLRVNGNAIASYADAAVKVATTSTTITANTAAPSGSVVAYAAAADATDKVWVTWNMAVVGMADADVTHIDQLAGGTAVVIDTCALVAGTFTYACDVAAGGDALVAGDTVKVAANAVTSGATTPVKSGAAFTTAVVTDATKPVLLTATYTTPVASTAAADQASLALIGTGAGAGGASAGNGVASAKGDVTITVLGSGPYAGKAGNTIKLVADLNAGIAAGTATCAFNAATKTITIVVQAVTVEAPLVATTCNNAATMQGNFVATAATDTAGDYDLAGVADSTAAGGYALAGGKNKFNVTLTFSEPLSAFAAANVPVTTNCATSCASNTPTVVTTAATEAAQELAGVITLAVSSTTTPSAGLDKVTAAAAILDRNGNALATGLTPATHIVFMQLGS
jgi:putative cell wall-binding protein